MNHNLFDPLVFRTGLTTRNRVFVAPLTNKQSHEDGTLSDGELRFLAMRADGGFGLVMTCASHIAKDGQGWPGELGIFDAAHTPGLTRLAGELHTRGAKGMVQIFHGGVRADTTVSGIQPWSASELEGARAATSDDLTRVIAQFTDAALRAQQAGFDGVEIHGAHGYLLTQFLSTVQNLRTDEWGGSLENRARLAREVMRAVRKATDKTFTVGIRLSAEDFGNAKGLDLDESIQVAKWLAEDGADFIHLSLWRAGQNTQKYPEQHAASMFRAALPSDVRIIAAGAIYTVDDAQAVLDRGADAVALGRSAILNPAWPVHAASNEWRPQRPPVTVEQLEAFGLSAPFVNYMKSWKGFVK